MNCCNAAQELQKHEAHGKHDITHPGQAGAQRTSHSNIYSISALVMLIAVRLGGATGD